MIMTHDMRQTGGETSLTKRRWTEPKIETIEGREARANFARYGGVDAGIYS